MSGAASRVGQVVAVRGQLDLSASRNPIEVDLRLYPQLMPTAIESAMWNWTR